MTLALLLISDGREDYLDRTIASATDHGLLDLADQFIHVDDSHHRLGFAGAIQAGWEQVRTDYVFHLEQDFTFPERPPVEDMVALLRWQPQLAQVALKRQPWNHEERRAGGIVELHPDDFTERNDAAVSWTEHRRFWTTNPCVYSSRWCREGWPQEPQSEGMFTHRLLRDPLLRFAFFGGKFDPPRVLHIGDERTGRGY